MGRMHSAGKGMSKSARPYKRTPPSWLKVTAEDVEEHICKFAKKGLTPSQIGVILRDSHGIAQVKSVTGSKVLRLLKKNGASPLSLYYLPGWHHMLTYCCSHGRPPNGSVLPDVRIDDASACPLRLTWEYAGVGALGIPSVGRSVGRRSRR